MFQALNLTCSFILQFPTHYKNSKARVSQVVVVVKKKKKKNPACQCRRRKSGVRSLDGEDPLEKGMATHSSILAWRIPWTEAPGGLQSIRLHRVGHD